MGGRSQSILTHHHEGGGQGDPAHEPVVVDPVTDHLLDAVVEPSRPKHPAYGDGLEEDAPEQRHPTGGIEVHQLKDVDAVASDHGEAEEEHHDGHGQGELLPVGLQQLGPVVHQPRHQGLHSTELRVNAQCQQHHEEKEGPEGGGGDGEHHLGVDEEGEPGTGLDHIPHIDLLGVSHVPEDGEDDDGREERGEGVDAAHEDGILVAVVVELVVASKGEKGANADSIREEDLSAAV